MRDFEEAINYILVHGHADILQRSHGLEARDADVFETLMRSDRPTWLGSVRMNTGICHSAQCTTDGVSR